MGQWVKGKSHDTFGPIGPYLVTKDDISDVNNLNLSLDVNGKRMQTGNSTSNPNWILKQSLSRECTRNTQLQNNKSIIQLRIQFREKN